MALYVGRLRKKIRIGDTVCCIRLYASIAITNGIRLVSSDNYTLKSKDNLYLTVKEDK